MKKNLLNFLKAYVLTWLFSLLFVLYRASRPDISIVDAFENYKELLSYSAFIIGIHITFVLFYLLFLIIRYFFRTYKKQGFKSMFKQLVFRLIIPIALIISLYNVVAHSNSNEDFNYLWNGSIENTKGISNDLYNNDRKHRGMSVFGWHKASDTEINELVKNNVEWIAVVPFLYQKDEKTTKINVPDTVGIWTQRDSVFIKSIEKVHSKNMHVMLKPHLWMSSGWRSNVSQSSKSDWNTWFTSYRNNMLHYAKMANETNVELFCIGTELKSSIKQQPQQWIALIKEIKNIYKGKLTYAANWDGEFEFIDFWNELDYIGIQAYFPLTKVDNPDLETIKKGWDSHITMLEKLSKKHNKPILFTEVGYKSDASTTIKPWEWAKFSGIIYNKKSDKTQQLAYEALFQRLWSKDWFSGMYIWEWDTRSKPENAEKSLNFSPRFKPAQNTIAKWYGKSSFWKE